MTAMKEELEKVFFMFVDETNKMPCNSIDNAIRSAGYVLENSLESTVSKSHVTYSEFLELIRQAQLNQLSKEKIEESFRYFDPEDTGFIKAVDFKQILSTGNEPLPEEDINSILEMFPPNAEGLICYSLPISYVFDENNN